MPILSLAEKDTSDPWIKDTYLAAINHVQGRSVNEKKEELITALTGVEKNMYVQGHEIYNRDAHCVTCHQEDGEGLEASGFPSLVGTEWVNGDIDRLIKLTLKGLHGPITVNGEKFPGMVPMTPFEGLLSDAEIAAVLTYVRNSFMNESGAVFPDQVAKVRKQIAEHKGFYKPGDLLKAHPVQ